MASKKDGFGVRIMLQTSGITFQEKGVTPPGVDGQDPVSISHNAKVSYVEKLARALKELTPASGTVVYDPAQISTITSAINVHQVIWVSFKEGDAVAFYGFLRKFEPEEMQDGEQPTASIELVPCGVNAAGTEEGLLYYTTTTTTTT
jgi:hypothetical protein